MPKGEIIKNKVSKWLLSVLIVLGNYRLILLNEIDFFENVVEHMEDQYSSVWFHSRLVASHIDTHCISFCLKLKDFSVDLAKSEVTNCRHFQPNRSRGLFFFFLLGLVEEEHFLSNTKSFRCLW